jgi:hypothetical protein
MTLILFAFLAISKLALKTRYGLIKKIIIFQQQLYGFKVGSAEALYSSDMAMANAAMPSPSVKQ